MATKIETTAAQNTADYASLTAVALRKLAASEYAIKGASKGKKADLLAAIYAAEVERLTIEALAVEIAKGSNPREALDEVARANAAQEAEEELLREAAREHDAAAEKIAAELTAKLSGKTKTPRTATAKRDLDQSSVDADGEIAAEAKPAPAKKVAKGKCQVCGVKPISRKTQGRDSTMCTGCYDYAADENYHSDNNHEELGAQEDCLVCQGANPANGAPATAKAKAKAAKRAPAAKKAPAKIVEGENPKAARFAADAKAAGWKIGSITKSGNVTTVIVTLGAQWVEISWDGTQCVNTGTTHKGQDGKVRKVRNASAARAILAA